MPYFEYPIAHTGTALICGSADCLYDDLDSAPFRRDAILIGVNGAPVRALHRFSVHWRNLRAKAWIKPGEVSHSVTPRDDAPWVNYWWPTVNDVPGTSGWAAAKMAELMGFTEIILCGIPIDDSAYTNGRPARTFEDPGQLRKYREAIEGDIAHHAVIRSMSGWTQELLGSPI